MNLLNLSWTKTVLRSDWQKFLCKGSTKLSTKKTTQLLPIIVKEYFWSNDNDNNGSDKDNKTDNNNNSNDENY